MAIEYLDGERIIGLSTDTKPTDVDAGSMFVETDTGNIEFFNGTCWFNKPFESINASFGKNLGVAVGQHFVEWFTGSAFDDHIWAKNDVRGGAGTVAMTDEVNGGVKITTGSSANSETRFDFNDKRQFSASASSMIFVQKRNAGATGQSMSGLRDNTSSSDGTYACFIVNSVETSDAYFRFFTHNDGSGYSTNFSQGRDENWHVFKIESTASACKGWVDGVLGVTQSDSAKLPKSANNGKWMPFFGMYGNSVACSSQIRYCEVWNH